MQTTHPCPTEIATAIIKSFESLPVRVGHGKGDGDWTKQLKDDIGTLGEKNRWTVCAGGFKGRFEGGWLYDLVWYNEANGHLSEVYLVLESEWGEYRTDIKYDFEKLLVAKATLKVMVFQTKNGEIEDLFGFLEEGIRAFPLLQSANETYLLIAFNNDTGKFDIRQYNGCGARISANPQSVPVTQ
jgi:hypothetical protein